MKCNFVVGQKVVCINECGTNQDTHPGIIAIKKGDILTVREITQAPRRNGQILIGVRFKEVVNVTSPYSVCWEYDYSPKNFRPLVERKTDISVFKAMLTPAGRIPVDA